MAHPQIEWFCGACGYKRGEAHTCPPDPGETIGSLVDALPRNRPGLHVLTELAHLKKLRDAHRPDSVQVDAATLSWLLSAFSYLEVATEKLTPYTAEALNAAPTAPAAAPKAPDPRPRPCIWCNGVGGNQCPECYVPDTERGV
jgi:hypothetical protein